MHAKFSHGLLICYEGDYKTESEVYLFRTAANTCCLRRAKKVSVSARGTPECRRPRPVRNCSGRGPEQII